MSGRGEGATPAASIETVVLKPSASKRTPIIAGVLLSIVALWVGFRGVAPRAAPAGRAAAAGERVPPAAASTAPALILPGMAAPVPANSAVDPTAASAAPAVEDRPAPRPAERPRRPAAADGRPTAAEARSRGTGETSGERGTIDI